MLFRKLSLTLFGATLVAGCGLTDVRKDVDKGVKAMQKGPSAAAQYNRTNFSDALSCMDRLMLTHHVRDATFVVEDLSDNTGKMRAGTRDMLISAVSEMSRRSRAVQLNAYGTDTGNLIGLLERAQRRDAYAVVPQYDMRGSISQLDENVAKKQADIGVYVDPSFGLGSSKSSNASILALDLSIVDTSTLLVIPGVVSKNTVVIYKDGKGLDTEATYRKLGINFSMSFAVNEGQGQALRNLIELGAIELTGRLFKLPYWTCLGVDAATPEVVREIEDWYYAMEAHGELAAFVKKQLQLRGHYAGPVDDKYDAQTQQAVAQFNRAHGLGADSQVDLALFKQFLMQPVVRPATPVAPPTAGLPAGALGLSLELAGKTGAVSKGAPFGVTIRSDANCYLYCFYQDDRGAIQRFYPNRFSKDAYLASGQVLRLPGTMPFKFHASKTGLLEKIACYATAHDVFSQTESIRASRDFEPMQVSSIREIGAAIALSSNQRYAEKELLIKVQP